MAESEQKPVDSGVDSPTQVAARLAGRLPCARCRYDLSGISVLGGCPECGLAVRETLAAVIDPLAERMPRLTAPRLTATALVVWSLSAALACAIIWLVRLVELFAAAGSRIVETGHLPEVAVGLLLLSGVSSIVLVRPHAGLSTRRAVIASVGVLAYFPLASFVLFMMTRIDPLIRSPYFSLRDTEPERLGLRLLIGLTLVVILLCLRQNARTLAARSYAIRSGRKHRQTMLGMVSAVGLAAIGDVTRLVGNGMTGLWAEVIHGTGIVLVAVGSALLLTGLVASVVDTVRLWRVLAADRAAGRVVLVRGEG